MNQQLTVPQVWQWQFLLYRKKKSPNFNVSNLPKVNICWFSMTLNWVSCGFGLLVTQNKQIKCVTLGLGISVLSFWNILFMVFCIFWTVDSSRKQQERGMGRDSGGRMHGKGHWLDWNQGRLSYMLCVMDLWIAEVYAFENIKDQNQGGKKKTLAHYFEYTAEYRAVFSNCFCPYSSGDFLCWWSCSFQGHSAPIHVTSDPRRAEKSWHFLLPSTNHL